ncbi:hypothetical protein H1R20_g11406, partial [Candolleomyces eurysporus]
MRLVPGVQIGRRNFPIRAMPHTFARLRASPQWAILHDPEVYPDPMAFKPERFLTADGKSLDPKVQDPYFSGASGLNYRRSLLPVAIKAFAQDVLTAAYILAVFDVTPPKDESGNTIALELKTLSQVIAQALGTAVVEGDPSDLSIQSNSPAAATSHRANEPQEYLAHAEDQLAGLGKKIYEGVKTTLQRIVDVSDVFPPLKSTAAGLLAICNTIDAYGENHEEFDALLKRVEALSRIIDESPADVQQGIQDRFSGLSRTLEEKKKILQDKVNPNRSVVDRAILTDQDKQEVLKLTQEIRFAIEIALFDATIGNMNKTLHIVSGADWLKGRIEIIEGHTGDIRNIEEAVRSLKRSNTFEKLGGVEGAEFSNPQRGSGCTPGSRISLLAMLLVWAQDPCSPHLFWLSGLAGTGKTAVSKSFCSQLNDRGLLGASFFCTLSELNQKDVYLIIPTLARILAESRPKFGDALEKVLESDGACRTPLKMDLKAQYAKLILQPVKEAFAADELLVLGVDALDECENKEAVKLFIEAILSQKPTIPLKFFLTSRPEVALRESFETSTQHGQLRLHDIEASIVKADILLYLNDRFKCIPRVYNHYQAKSNWPPPEVQVIADVSGTLFIIAATMATTLHMYSFLALKLYTAQS